MSVLILLQGKPAKDPIPIGDPGDPPNVTDLGIDATTSTTLDISWTGVHDGNGVSPAGYDIRVMPTPMAWGSQEATDSQVAYEGTTVGGEESTTLTGLIPSTSYDVQLVPRRGPSGSAEAFGALSNIETDSTDAGAVGTPGTPVVSISASNDDSFDLSTTAFSGAGGETGHASTTWYIYADGDTPGVDTPVWQVTSASNLTSYSAAGASEPLSASTAYDIYAKHTGELGGDSALSAKVDGTTDSATPGTYPNEPSSMNVMAVHPFDVVEPSGWNHFVNYEPLTVSGGVGTFTYEVGQDGGAPANVVKSGGFTGRRHIYVYIKIRPSTNWQGHDSGINKLVYLVDNSAGSQGPFYVELYGWNNGPLRLGLSRQAQFQGSAFNFRYNSAGNGVSNDETLTKGSFNELELDILLATAGNSDGTIDGWVNGTKVLEFTGVSNTKAGHNGTITKVNVAPIWGGVGDSVVEEMYLDFDEVYVSGKDS